MKNLIIPFLFTFFAFAGFSQKVKVKKKTIYVDGMEYMTYDKEVDGGNFNFTFYDLNGEEIAYADMRRYNDPNAVDNISPDGEVIYYSVQIEGVKESFEIKVPMNIKKKIAKLFYKGKVINDGKIDLAKAERLTKRKGRPHTTRIEQIEAAKQGGDVIIIKEESPSLINIKL